MKVAVCLPTYNERDCVERTIQEIFALDHKGLLVIVIDDNSPDGTSGVVEQLAGRYPDRIVLIKRNGKLGLGSAYKAGFQKALELGADLIVEMDADGSHDPRDLPTLIDAAGRGVDLAIGSRWIAGGRVLGWGIHRYLMSRGAIWFSKMILRLKVQDVTSGFRCYRRDVIRHLVAMGISSGGYAFQEETLYRCQQAGFQIVEIPITFRERRFGSTKLSWKDVCEFFKVILILRFQKKPALRSRGNIDLRRFLIITGKFLCCRPLRRFIYQEAMVCRRQRCKEEIPRFGRYALARLYYPGIRE